MKFKTMKCQAANDSFNLGSVNYQLCWQDSSTAELIVVPQNKIAVEKPVESFYNYLAQKQLGKIEDFNAIKPQYLRGGEANW